MIYPGLTSITFRDRGPERIIDMAVRAELDAIEWGGDVHVPHGEFRTAEKIGRDTRAAGLAVSSYGSYYRAAVSEHQGLMFNTVLDTAEALQAPLIRIWAGNKDSDTITEEERNFVIEDCCRAGDMAAGRGLRVALEYHNGTLTDTPESTIRLLNETAGHNIETLWQPRPGHDRDTSVSSLRQILPRLANLHVFYWWPDNKHRLPLQEGRALWRTFLQVVAAEAPPGTRYALLEFVKKN